MLLAGHDLVGLAQTGTGKTAAFALPLLERLNPTVRGVQALVLTPTRELALQVCAAIENYAAALGGVRVLPVYGGDSMYTQISRLRSGVSVVVGTPGRVMDHLRRGTLALDALQVVVLDEADEMLRMGFAEDIDWILEQAPKERQTALFSATMPREVRRLAEQYLREPVNVEIQRATRTAPDIAQRVMRVQHRAKLEALAQLLAFEATPGEAALVFTRTKAGADEVTDALVAHGFTAEAMHGDMNQAHREAVVRKLRAGQVDVVIATDVAARGLDVERIALVVNLDLPNDPESYVHRIGRTGRAGRSGKAVLFVTPREERLVLNIERYTGQKLTSARVPSDADIAARRAERFKARLVDVLETTDLDDAEAFVHALAAETGQSLAAVAAAAVRLTFGDAPLVTDAAPFAPKAVKAAPVAAPVVTENGMVRLHVDAGRNDGIRAGDIVGALANRTGIPVPRIGNIDVFPTSTLVEVPAEFHAQALEGMEGVILRGKPSTFRLSDAQDVPAERPAPREARPAAAHRPELKHKTHRKGPTPRR